MSKKIELEITCTRCGDVSYAPFIKRAPRKPNRALVNGARLMAAGSALTIGGSKNAAADEARAARLEQQMRDYTDATRAKSCPSCGTQAVKVKQIRV